jgi:hypothetical protein
MTDRSTACPICGGVTTDRKMAPFCSERCRTIDLGQWLNGAYRLPGPPTGPQSVRDEAPPADESS